MRRKFIAVPMIALLAIVVAIPLLFSGSSVRAASEADIETAISDGLTWLETQQLPDGCWHSNYDQAQAATTGLTVWKFEEYAKEQGYNPLDPAYQYHAQVEHGLNCIFSRVQEEGGLVWIGNTANRDTYLTAIDMIAIAASNNPTEVVPALGSDVDGWTYQAVLQGMLDWMAEAQNDGTPGYECDEGGWGYHLNDVGHSDQSNTGYAVMGIGFAVSPSPAGFGLAMPAGVVAKLNTFIDNVQRPDGGSDYSLCDPFDESNILRTGNLLYEMAMVGRDVTDSTVQAAIDFIDTAWDWQGDDQATFTMTKGLQAYGIDLLSVNGDWFDQTSTYIVNHQNPDGSWSGSWNDTWLETAWNLLSLEPTAFVPPPPPPPLPPGGVERETLDCLAPSGLVDTTGDGTLDTPITDLSLSGDMVVVRSDPGDGYDVDPYVPKPPHRDGGVEPDGLADIEVEIVQMELRGTSPLFVDPIIIRAGSDFGLTPSKGAAEELAPGTGFPAVYFYDVFLVLTGTPYGPLTTDGPVHFEATVNAIPAFGEVFESLSDLELKDGGGIIRMVLSGGACTPGPAAVGGIIEMQVDGSHSPASLADGSGSSSPPYALIAGAAAAGALALAAGAWYARRRWVR